jgi:hypothetical protein
MAGADLPLRKKIPNIHFLYVFQYNNLLDNRGLVAGLPADVELQQCGARLQFHRQGAHSFIV